MIANPTINDEGPKLTGLKVLMRANRILIMKCHETIIQRAMRSECSR